MKRDINVTVIIATIVAAIVLIFPFSMSAQNYAIKVYGDVGLGSAMSLTTELPGMTAKSSSNAFGVDFGYTFWHKNANSLEVNVGLGCRMATSTFNISNFSYNYAAPATADEDGNPYQRFTTISDVEQKISLGYFNIPVYLQYQYRASKWFGIYADLGLDFGFKCISKIGSTIGIVNNYGVYPEYDQLVIKSDYLNGFGETHLYGRTKNKPDIKGFSATMLAGAGFELFVGDPVSIDLGVRYNTGLTNVFAHQYSINSPTMINAENAPVTYNVAQGQQVKALSDYVTKSRLNPFSLHIGLNLRF